MQVTDVQRLLAEANYYNGPIDGDAGLGTMRGVSVIEGNAGRSFAEWPTWRRLTHAGQAILTAQGYSVGDLDGLTGPQTDEALTQWRSDRAGTDASVDRTPTPEAGARSHPAQMAWPLQRDVRAFFGPAGAPACTAGVVALPFPFLIAWNKSQSVSRFYCHEKVAEPLTWIFAEAHRTFGAERMRDMGLDLYGGCFANRTMRGGTATSMHAWGIAVDLDPEHNQLRWGADRARFANPDYRDWWQIVMQAGAVPAGYVWGKDWMHFQFARL
ncbi:M15 family metallopeptidase [Paracoccus homiensis]|uniref:M15 family metallopeptidase n=1 Tax=Paracoccus homiensis TaxID=364199 RepID=UPI00398C96B9